MSSAGPELQTLRLLDMPLRHWASAKQHNDELMREFALIAGGAESAGGESPLPQRLLDLITQLRQQYGQGSAERDARLFDALEDGVDHLDVELQLPAAAVGALAQMAALLDEADAFCQQGQHLLTLTTPPELVAYRHWYLGELTAQLGGAAPTPWREPQESGPQRA